VIVRPLAEEELELVDARLPLNRLDTAQTYLVAWDGAEPVGHAHLAWTGTTLGLPELQDVFVLPEHRGRGVGTELTRAGERLAAERGHSRMSLSVGAENDAARRLYERLGYVDAEIEPQRVLGTIVVRGKPFAVDDTLVYLVKEL
jgi:ribosomal protein S18 acetylase RimI-like enzyme